ncbi:MAG TPA: PKD domain-containing protein [Solirubrobacteraceae bacterium]|nr:PKD domain-containing protein [Solirubrobacteraceae bacterium]
MRRFALASLAVTATFLGSLALSASAGAVVVDPAALGQTTVQYPFDQANYVGVAMVPGTESSLSAAGVPYVGSGTCSYPWMSSDFALPDTGLCYHGGSVIHRNETFDLTWDPKRLYWSGTRGYVQQFLRDVAQGSGTLTSPYALTTQYRDPNGRAENSSIYGGSCLDYGNPYNVANANATCTFGSSVQSRPGTNYPGNGCQPTNDVLQGDGSYAMFGGNGTCLTDGQLRNELARMAQTGMLAHTQPGYTPLVVMLVPPQVEVCLDGSATLCSANSGAVARFCSYHSHLAVNTADGSREVDYVVQPWTALTGCDEPGTPAVAPLTPPGQLSAAVGANLVSPLSQGEIAAIVDPSLNGWYAMNGLEINDNGGCTPLGGGLDSVIVGQSTQNPYLLQREFNNAGLIESDPFTYFGCAPNVILVPSFVVPRRAEQGEMVSFDGSNTESTLLIPSAADYIWKFGDGTSKAYGPSVVHRFARAGYYNVTLTVIDRGGNVGRLTQTVEVFQPNGQPPSGAPGPGGKFEARLQLLPQSLKDVLHNGLAVRLSANEPADGFATLLISRAAAQRAHIHGARTSSGVVVGRGTLSGIKNGTASLRVRISSSTVSQLAHLSYLSLTLRLALVGQSGRHVTVQATGRY